MLLNESLRLRPATPADWPAIATLLESRQLPLAGARDHLATFAVATLDERVVGVAGAEVHGDVALLRSVAVEAGMHGRGIGRRLVELMLVEATRRDIVELFLLTTSAAEYFPRFGFTPRDRAQAPAALAASAEFQGACPDSAALLGLRLRDRLAPSPGLPVAVIGAGPVGLAAVARLLERGIEPLVFEAGASVGASYVDFGHVRLFSPWRANLDPSMTAMLTARGWTAPPAEELPLAGEVVRQVLEPFAGLPEVARHLRLRSKVVAITREGHDKVLSAGREGAPFVLRVERDGVVEQFRARAVIDASGTWQSPNPLGGNGLPALGERQHAARIHYGIPDVLGAARGRYAGKRTLVVGAGHSAANSLLALSELAREAAGTRFVWAVRSESLARVFGGGAADGLPARGQLGTALKALRDSGQMEFVSGVRIEALERDGASLRVRGRRADGEAVEIADVDEIICATGQRPDLGMTRELRLALDPWLESAQALGPLIDPNLHSCGSVRPHGHRELSHPEAGFYTVGVKSYGRAPTFLMMTGFEQVRSVVAALAGDLAAADRLELELPETGVCSVSADVELTVGSACCGPTKVEVPAPAASACCAAAPAAATESACCAKPAAATSAACCG
ncbi:MAG: arsenic resistance N-acetyltransferase ArsN2 [Gammaproteobacteria bacterium]